MGAIYQWVLSTVGAIYTNNNYSLPSAENQERGTISAHTTAMNCLCIGSAPDLYQQCVRPVSQLLLLAHAVNIITHSALRGLLLALYTRLPHPNNALRRVISHAVDTLTQRLVLQTAVARVGRVESRH